MVPVALPADLVTADPEALKQTFLALTVAGKPVALTGEHVTRAGTAALQLLLAFLIRARELELHVELRAPSRALLDALGSLGLAHHPEVVAVLSKAG